ncbi:predicted protein [Thalassiosira pseudonana CCMP1335]|uniref:Fascin domain-containing protein n=1 Tax=Thalassiosira pseudonana TaxID=35128 RepID=B8BV77_THAPS|nr:predicted protein [Thalassiosira pseudonana CCMP1335]EED95411.1 predicted protein [Thalassiosira pseudonana CCMP1335]
MKESYATKSQALQFYEVENSSRNGKDVDMLLGKIFLDLELFRCVHSDMKSNLYRRLPIELVPAAEKKTTGEAWEDTTTASSQNSTEDFSVFDYATKICDVSIQHNTGTYLSVKNAEVSLVPNFDARSCVFALCTHADNFPRDLKEPIQNGGGTLGEFVGEKASDHHHRLPDSRQIIELEHKAIVGFRHQASGKWLGRNGRIFGGNLVCENDAFGEEEEFEINDLCRDNTIIFNRGKGGYLEVQRTHSSLVIRVFRSAIISPNLLVGRNDNAARERAALWRLKEIHDFHLPFE